MRDASEQANLASYRAEQWVVSHLQTPTPPMSFASAPFPHRRRDLAVVNLGDRKMPWPLKIRPTASRSSCPSFSSRHAPPFLSDLCRAKVNVRNRSELMSL